jgi:hypothetical protein
MSAPSKPSKSSKAASKGERPAKEGADAEESAAVSGRGLKTSDPPMRRSSQSTKPAPTIWQRTIYRWTAITVVMAVLLVLWTYHPYYKNQQFTPFKTVYPVAFVVWLCVGLFYVKATIEKFSERRYLMRDSGLHLVMLGKRGWVDVLSPLQWRILFGLGLAFAGLVGLRVLSGGNYLPAAVKQFGSGMWSSAAMFATAFPVVVMLARGIQGKRIWRLVRNPRIRTTLLAICVKSFFTPLMTGFVVGHLNGISRAWLTHKHLPAMDFKVPNGASIFTSVQMWWTHVGSRLSDLVPTLHDLSALFQPWTWERADVSWGLGFAYDIIFAVDCGWALFGYASESRWLGNKTRSVEPTAFGWLVCITCYPPFNNVLGTYLPLENGPALFTNENVQLALRGGVVFLFAIYASATVAFGFKFSNLTNRGIVSRGPYKYVRHPAYLTKCCAWWLEHVPTLTLTKAFFLSLLCGWYALRAWTEERHLSMDPEYREYKKKTPWVLFPGVY